MSAVAARPFPWTTLDATTTEQVRALRLVRRWAAAYTDLGRLPAVLGDLLGTEVDVRVRRAEPLTAGRALGTGAAVHLSAAGEDGVGRAALVEAEGPLVAAVVRRLARRPPASAVDPGGLPPAGVTGAFAAVVAAAVRRAHQGVALQVMAAGSPSSLEADLARGGEALLAVTLTVLVEHDAFTARVVVPLRAALGAPSLPWTARTLAALGAIPLALPLVACAFRTSVVEVARLGPGDVVVPSAWPLGRDGDVLQGPVWLAAPASEVGLRAQLVPGGRLVLGGGLEALVADAAPEANMGSNTGAGTGAEIERAELIDAIGDVPVLVRVELGEARMAAREWAAVGKGDVVTLGRRVGEAVVLRVGGVPVARGDLVEVDGEVGVRIVERLAGEGGAT